MPTKLDSLSPAVTEDGVAIVKFSSSPFNAISESVHADLGHLSKVVTQNMATGTVAVAAPQGARPSNLDHVAGVDGRLKPRISKIRHDADLANAAFAHSSNVANVEFATIDFVSEIATPTTRS